MPPVHLVITAASQPISSMEKYRDFVEKAIKITDVTVHANTGEFRRLLNNGDGWRQDYDAANDFPFEGLDGSALETAKREAVGYRDAKKAANINTIEEVAIPLAGQSEYNTRFVVTDGGDAAYVIINDKYLIYHPAPLDKSKIVNKVGAGDAFMAGFWAGQLVGLNEEESMKAAGIFAQAAIAQQEARLPATLSYSATGLQMSGPLALLSLAGLIKPKPSDENLTM